VKLLKCFIILEKRNKTQKIEKFKRKKMMHSIVYCKFWSNIVQVLWHQYWSILKISGFHTQQTQQQKKQKLQNAKL
jgi:hypothetical protein